MVDWKWQIGWAVAVAGQIEKDNHNKWLKLIILSDIFYFELMVMFTMKYLPTLLRYVRNNKIVLRGVIRFWNLNLNFTT